MKGKTNNLLPWISSILIAIIIIGALTLIPDSVTHSNAYNVLVPNSFPSAQVLGLSVIESINEFSGETEVPSYYKESRIGIAVSILFMFVIIPFLFVKGTLQSEKRENPTALWYVGSALLLLVISTSIIKGGIKMSVHQNTRDSAQISRTYDLMRTELTDVSFIVVEQVLELNDIEEMSKISTENIPEVKKSDYQYRMVTNPQDTSVTISISSNQVSDFTATTIIRPYSDQIFKYQRTYSK
ncbi:MAG: hypothetical protein ABJH08_10655 [Balneola sp.]